MYFRYMYKASIDAHSRWGLVKVEVNQNPTSSLTKIEFIGSIICLEIYGNCSSIERPGNGENSADIDTKLITPEETHDEVVH